MLATATRSILGAGLPDYELAVWHGITLPFLMSIVALGGGMAFYLVLHSRGRTMVRTPLLSRLNARRTFDVVDVAMIRGAARLTHVLYSWRLQGQLLWIVCCCSSWTAAAADHGLVAR
jgi:multicomponent K+:H+ antiporter subunit A